MSSQLLPIVDASRYTDLKLCECGKEQCIPNKHFIFKTKSYHLFHYVLSGKGTFAIANKVLTLSRGSLFYIPPHYEAHYSPLETNPWKYIWVGFDGQFADFLVKSCGFSNNNYVYLDSEGALRPLFEALFERYSSIGQKDIVCLGHMYQIFGHLIPKVAHGVPTLTIKQIYVNTAKEFINYNYQFNIKIGDIANNVGINANYLSNIFKEINGLSPKQYLTQMRMQKAAMLLSIEKRKIKEIAKTVGYENQLHFSMEFKKIYGLSPLAYFKQNTGG